MLSVRCIRHRIACHGAWLCVWGPRSGRRLLSGWRYVYRLQSLLSLGCLEGHEGAFFEGLEPATLYPRVVDEKVLTPSSGEMKP